MNQTELSGMPGGVLFIQLKRAGDVVMTTPVAEVLHTRRPEVPADFLVDPEFAPLLEHNPFIRSVIPYDRHRPWRTLARIRNGRYSWIFDFQSSPRSAPLALLGGAAQTCGFAVPFWGRVYGHRKARPGSGMSYARGKISLLEPLIGSVNEIPERRLFVTDLERAEALARLPGPVRGWIGLIPPHRRSSRRWPAESFASLARSLVKSGHAVALFAGPGEEELVEAIGRAAPGSRLVKVRSFREWGGLLERCRLVVSNDNGPSHLAMAVGCATVIIYGPTDGAVLHPERLPHRAVRLEGLGCLGCNMNDCPFGHECMIGVTPERVLRDVEDLFSSASAGSLR